MELRSPSGGAGPSTVSGHEPDQAQIAAVVVPLALVVGGVGRSARHGSGDDKRYRRQVAVRVAEDKQKLEPDRGSTVRHRHAGPHGGSDQPLPGVGSFC